MIQDVTEGYTCRQRLKRLEGYTRQRAWQQEEPIKPIMFTESLVKKTWYELWKDLTSSNGTAMFSQVIKHLTDCTRHAISRNCKEKTGVYGRLKTVFL